MRDQLRSPFVVVSCFVSPHRLPLPSLAAGSVRSFIVCLYSLFPEFQSCALTTSTMYLSIPLLLAVQLGASIAAPLSYDPARRAVLSDATGRDLHDTMVVVRRPVTKFKRSQGTMAAVAAAKAQAQAPSVAAACAASAAPEAQAAAAEGGEGEEGEEEVLVDAAFGDIVEIAGTDIKTDVLFTPTVRLTSQCMRSKATYTYAERWYI
jgi:hypothetical protein